MARVSATLLVWAMALASASAEPGRAGQTPGRRLLDVPYVAQTPELCGGAAVAMVMRYWGERQVFPEDFAGLVVASERGIPTGVLANAVRSRKWQAAVVAPDPLDARARIRNALDLGQPLIALIEVSPRTYHYVVIVGATDRELVLHDPARSPFRVMSWDGFDRDWAAAGRWMMLVLPPAGSPTPDAREPRGSPAAVAGASVTPCDGLVERGVTLALGGESTAAEQSLVTATRVCPASSSAWRELAGLRFLQSRWAEAEDLARTAVRLAPDDQHARELLATSRYLQGNETGALDAWTAMGEPRIDSVTIHGADRTHHPVVVRATGLLPRQVLTSEAFRLALRRVQALPVASGARVHFEPLDGGLTKVDLHLSERDAFPRGWVTLGVLAGRAGVGKEFKADLAGLFGAGERISAAGRWKEERPRAALGVSLPSPRPVPGVLSLEGAWERQSYPALRQTRRRVTLLLTDWSASWMRWKAGVSVDRFEADRYRAVEAGVDLRLARDHMALAVSGAEWFPAGDGNQFGTASVHVAFRSTTEPAHGMLSAWSEVSVAGRDAPLAVWEGAGTGSARAGLLRAHPLLRDDVLTGPAFGRRLARGTLEYAQPVSRTRLGTLSVAGFVDAARAWQRFAAPGPSPLYVDLGVGLRFRMPGRTEGVRLDVATGLRGGGVTFSAGWLAPWPR